MYHYGLGCHVGANVLQPGDPWYAGPDQGAGGTQEEAKDMVEHPKIITEEEARGGGTATPPPAAPGGGLFSGFSVLGGIAGAAMDFALARPIFGKKPGAIHLILGFLAGGTLFPQVLPQWFSDK